MNKLLTSWFFSRKNNNNVEYRTPQGIIATIAFYVVVLFLVICLFGSFGVVDETQRGVKITFGKLAEEVVQPGFFVKAPIITTVKKFDVKVIKKDAQMATYTKDIQTAELKISVSYQIDKSELKDIYAKYGDEWEEKIIWNNLTQAVKDVIGKYDAEKLIENRDVATTNILATANKMIEDMPATFTQFQLSDIEYNPEFEAAVESKVIAAQRAKEAENKIQQVTQEAEQKVIAAKAEATSMRIRSNALSQNANLIEYEKAVRWDGKLPTTYAGNSVPFMKIQ